MNQYNDVDYIINDTMNIIHTAYEFNNFIFNPYINDEIDNIPENTIVRDPIGDINFRAFAQDHENVQRTPIQNSTQISVDLIMEQPIPIDQDTYIEVKTALQRYADEKQLGYIIAEIFEELNNDICFDTTAFGYSYLDVLSHVWAIIRNHEHKSELIARLYEELDSGIGYCANGKICHLVTVLQGFDERVSSCVSRDAFQSKFHSLTKLPKEERTAAALTVFDDFSIPEEERQVWLETLLDYE